MDMNEEQLLDRYYELSWSYHNYWHSDIDRAISIIKEAIDVADQLDDKLMWMEERHWLAQAYVFRKQDYAKALPLVIESAVEARKPIYREWSTRVCLYQDLIAAHVGCDALSHEKTIEKALEQMEEEAPPNSQCVRCLAGERFEFEMARGNLEAAKQSLQHRLSITYTSHHKAAALFDQARLNFLDEKWQEMAESAAACQKQAELADSDDVVVDALLYQAVAHLKLGDEAVSADFYNQHVAQRALITQTMDSNYYEALIAYHNFHNDLPSAIAAQQEQLAALAGKGALRDEAKASISLCRLLKQAGKLTDTEVANARAAIMRLKVDGGLMAHLDSLLAEE